MAVELERLVGGIGVVALVRRESGGACRLCYGVVKGLAHLAQMSVLGIHGGETGLLLGGPCRSGRGFSGARTWSAGGSD